MRLFRLPAPLLSAMLILGMAGAAPATDVTQMTAKERSAFDAEVRAYLLQHPEVVMEAIQELQNQQQQQAAQQDQKLLSAYHKQIFDDPNSLVMGNPKGNITIVEFTDYQCTYCREALPQIADLLKTDGDIRLVIKEYPILGPGSMTATQFALAVKLTDGNSAYAKLHEALMTMSGPPTMPAMIRIAGQMGLDTKKIVDAMNSDPVMQIIKTNLALGNDLKINGTPAFVVGNAIVRGYLPEAQMAQLVAQERQAG